jgi:hypothetical protein
LEASGIPGQGTVSYSPIAVDDSGTPLAVQPMMTSDPSDPTKITVYNSDGKASSFQPEIYEHRDYQVFLETSVDEFGVVSNSPIAVDASGTPLAIQPLMAVDPTKSPGGPGFVTVYDNSGVPSPVQPESYYEITPGEYEVFLEVSGPPGDGTISYNPIAVDASGTPLPIQPLMKVDLTKPDWVTVYDSDGTQAPWRPAIHVPQDYSVYLEATGTPGHGAISYSPVAVDASGTPLAVQPLMSLDPTDPTKVTTYDAHGSPTSFEPKIYEPRVTSVFLEASGTPGHGTISYTPVAVDASGIPLPIQPLMTLDPTDPTQITLYDINGVPIQIEPDIYELPEYSVFLEATGTPGQGAISYSPVAVDASGTPLPVQPLMTLDPADPTKVTVYDHSGAPSSFQPDIYNDIMLKGYGELGTEEGAEAEEGTDETKENESQEPDEVDVGSGEPGAEAQAAEPDTGAVVEGLEEVVAVEEAETTAGTEEVSDISIPIPDTAAGDEEVSATPITLPGQAIEDPDTIEDAEMPGATPLPIPEPPTTETATAAGGEEISATPITLPDTAIEGPEEISATPITLPDTAIEGPEEISVLPVPVPEPPAAASTAVAGTEAVSEAGLEETSATEVLANATRIDVEIVEAGTLEDETSPFTEPLIETLDERIAVTEVELVEEDEALDP